ncbi:UNVERIFIED_CONTAM: hypothetical protein Sindi_2289800 [Sesamum indicum]
MLLRINRPIIFSNSRSAAFCWKFVHHHCIREGYTLLLVFEGPCNLVLDVLETLLQAFQLAARGGSCLSIIWGLDTGASPSVTPPSIPSSGTPALVQELCGQEQAPPSAPEWLPRLLARLCQTKAGELSPKVVSEEVLHLEGSTTGSTALEGGIGAGSAGTDPPLNRVGKVPVMTYKV